MIKIEESNNVYADLKVSDAEVMHVKACLTSRIADIIQERGLRQQQAAEILGIPQPRLSCLLRGQFRGISEAKLLECLNRLGHDIDIVVKKVSSRHKGQTQVICN